MWTIEKKRKRSALSVEREKKKKDPAVATTTSKKSKSKKLKTKGTSSVERKRMSVTEYIDMKRQLFIKDLEVKKEDLLKELQVLDAKLPLLTARYQHREKLDALSRKDEIVNELDDISYGNCLSQFNKLVAPYYNRLQYVELEPRELTKTTIIKVHPKDVLHGALPTAKGNLPAQVGESAMTLNGSVTEESNKTVVLQDEAAGGELKDKQLQKQLQSALQEPNNSVMRVHMSNCDMCLTCHQPTVIMGAGAIMGCTKCKRTYTFIQATSSRIAYGEEVEFTSFSYRRENHFQEWLNCFQAKESTTLVKTSLKNKDETSVVEMVAQKCAELGYTDRSAIGIPQVREALKLLGLSKYYENQQQITTRISGKAAPTMTPQQEEQVRCMFSAIIPLFEKHKPPNRVNFLSYAYCLYKFCELMGWDQFLPCFTLLKGPDKLKKQDMIFEKICKDLDWEFIPSVEEHSDKTLLAGSKKE